jgi:hypothetical protein
MVEMTVAEKAETMVVMMGGMLGSLVTHWVLRMVAMRVDWLGKKSVEELVDEMVVLKADEMVEMKVG